MQKQAAFSAIRLFRRWKGVTPHRLIREMQLKKAELLPETTDRDVPKVAVQYGLRSLSVFYRAFRREKGAAPEAWKKRRNASDPASCKKKNDFAKKSRIHTKNDRFVQIGMLDGFLKIVIP